MKADYSKGCDKCPVLFCRNRTAHRDRSMKTTDTSDKACFEHDSNARRLKK